MPWQDPNFWNKHEIIAPALAFVLAILRASKDGERVTWPQRCLEGAMCGLITLSFCYAVDAFGMNEDLKVVAGGTIGYFGTAYITAIAKKIIDKKVG